MLESGADVNAQDKGGLIPLHNASSYGVSLSILQRMCEVKKKNESGCRCIKDFSGNNTVK